jgi:hypothetical protein
MCNKQFPVLLLAISLMVPTALMAQSSKKGRAMITGTVMGADNKPVAAAVVTCQSGAGFRPRVVRTDAQGHFVVNGLKWDSYDLRASAKGAYSDWEKNFLLKEGQTREITLYLLNGNTAISGKSPAKQKK